MASREADSFPNLTNADLERRPRLEYLAQDADTREGFNVPQSVFDERYVGKDGADGWSPVFALEADGLRRVLKLADWFGGTGEKPTRGVGEYLGSTGFVPLSSAIDVRGPQGEGGSDVDVDAVDERIRTLVADFAEQGSVLRLGKDRLPTDVSYRTDAQIESLADARILPEARTGSVARWDKGRLPTDAVYDGDALLLPDPSGASAGQVPKVNSALDGYVLADDEEGGGTGGTARTDAEVQELARDAAGAALVAGEGQSGSDLDFTADDANNRIYAAIKGLSVTAAKIAVDAVETAKIKALAVTEAKLADLAVATGKLKANAVTRAKLATDQQIPALTGQAGKILQVNSAGTALETTDKPSGGGGGTALVYVAYKVNAAGTVANGILLASPDLEGTYYLRANVYYNDGRATGTSWSSFAFPSGATKGQYVLAIDSDRTNSIHQVEITLDRIVLPAITVGYLEARTAGSTPPANDGRVIVPA